MKLTNIFLSSLLLVGAAACSDDKFDQQPPRLDEVENPGQTEEPGNDAPTSRNELYRPQVHYTPAKNWINDPNGLVYQDGTYHLYYQYNPQGNGWGNMSWGHATSKDLIHWEEQKVAMLRNQWGDIFSGSAVIDKNNDAGYGQNTLIAFYTGSGEWQQQCMAYSTDGGMTFTQYEGNPVIANSELEDFRDPKVFWHEGSKQWVMCPALGKACKIEFWGSKNLKNWEKLSTFTTDCARSNIGQWECPDLFPLPYKGGEKWVLIVSNNPGGPVGGSGTEYFVGDFDGKEFTAMPLDYPLWLDYGADNYAGVTWSNLPDNRKVLIGWMNNWNYCGDVPCSPWRSAMTLPRELTLKEVNGQPVMTAAPVKELDLIAGEWQNLSDGNVGKQQAYEIKANVNLKENSTIRISNDAGEYLDIEVNADAGKIIAHRTSSTGVVRFLNGEGYPNMLFAISTIAAPFNTTEDTMELHMVVDQSSVEIFSADGTMCMTVILFPQSIYNQISGVDGVSFRSLSSIW